jgi:hypothetical protein
MSGGDQKEGVWCQYQFQAGWVEEDIRGEA